MNRAETGICYVQLQSLNKLTDLRLHLKKSLYGCSSTNYVIVFDVEQQSKNTGRIAIV